ncbi:hypothetical protein PIB30_039072 [Stylosanthes scabra]|uniref:Uncharacterized protein n=1 Tax=Stylosanthes scabra TaxID=79078 RepID=A0ABU6VGB6_9FABA|nr:hypothetical protein [Stylosanthes scabra]
MGSLYSRGRKSSSSTIEEQRRTEFWKAATEARCRGQRRAQTKTGIEMATIEADLDAHDEGNGAGEALEADDGGRKTMVMVGEGSPLPCEDDDGHQRRRGQGRRPLNQRRLNPSTTAERTTRRDK